MTALSTAVDRPLTLTAGVSQPDTALAARCELCVERLTEGVDDPAVRTSLAAEVCEIQDELLRRTERSLSERTRRIAACERGLGRLRTVTTASQLIDRVCDELARSCGLERVLLSRVEDGSWRPWMVNQVVTGEPWYLEWAGRATPLAKMYLESAIAGQHRPALVSDTAGRRVHPIISAGRSNSFVVAPISPAGQVIGFLHADHGRGGRPCDETDRDLLWAFAEAFAHLYERTVLLDRLRAQRGRVRETLRIVDDALARTAEAELDLVLTPDDSSVSRTTSASADAEDALARLTRRERDILEIVAQGATNKEIAERLVLSVGTVKTHVKHILGKLGAVNRSQAIAAYLGSGVTMGPPLD